MHKYELSTCLHENDGAVLDAHVKDFDSVALVHQLPAGVLVEEAESIDKIGIGRLAHLSELHDETEWGFILLHCVRQFSARAYPLENEHVCLLVRQIL